MPLLNYKGGDDEFGEMCIRRQANGWDPGRSSFFGGWPDLQGEGGKGINNVLPMRCFYQ